MKRLAIALVALAFVAVACGSDVSGPREVLAYDLGTAGDISYDVDFDMDMSLEMSGMDELGSGAVDMDATFVGTVAYDVEPGPEPGQVELTVTTDVFPTRLLVAMDGEQPVELDDPDEIAATGEFDPDDLSTEQTFLIDESGNVLEASVDGVAVPLDALNGGFAGMGLGDATTFLGPELPDEAAGVGSEWTTTTETPIGPGSPPVVTTTVSRIDREETIDGRRVLVIVSRATTERVEFDSDTLEDLVEADPTIPAEEKDAFAFIDMSMTLDGVTSEFTSWFDPADGLLVRQEGTFPAAMTMSLDFLGEEIAMTMSMVMDMSMELAG